MITILFIQILYIIQEHNDYYTIHSEYYTIITQYNDYYTIHSNIIHNSTRVQWLLYYSFKYYT